MNDEITSQFKIIYETQKPMYEAWGEHVKEYILRCLSESGYDIGSILKIPVNVRVKDTDSIIAKAFFRMDKNYSDPINQITDKVGIRFVVMVEEQIKIVQKIIEKDELWKSSKDVDFEVARENAPELFNYQSVHYIVRNKGVIERNNIIIEKDIPCEIQIRTLEQHAYAELSHDYVYKSNIVIEPLIRRTLAKSMALNETTDDLFSKVYSMVSEEKRKYTDFMDCLSKIYPFVNRSEKINKEIYDNIECLIKKYDISSKKIDDLVNQNMHIVDNIDERQDIYLFMQPSVLLLYYLVKYHTNEFNRVWEYPSETVSLIYADLGISDARF